MHSEYQAEAYFLLGRPPLPEFPILTPENIKKKPASSELGADAMNDGDQREKTAALLPEAA